VQIDDTDIRSEKGIFTDFNDLDESSEIGSHNSGTATFNGKLDEVRIYDRALSEEEITALYDLEKPDYSKMLKEGLVAYYPFNGNAKDESGNGHDGKVNGVSPAADRNNTPKNAYEFFSKPGDIEIPHSESLSLDGGDFAISMWLRFPSQLKTDTPDQTSRSRAYGAVFSKRNTEDSENINGIHIGIFSYGEKGVSFGISDERLYYSPAGGMLQDNSWRHYVFQKKGQNLFIHVDSKQSADRSITVSDNYLNSAAIIIGANHQTRSKHNYQGMMDEVRIYNRALSEAEVKELYNLEKPKTDLKKGLLTNYQLIQGNFTWHEAKVDAEKRGGHLATITSEREHQRMLEQLKSKSGNNYYWLGATDEKNEGVWRWVTNEPFEYESWSDTSPDNVNNAEHYLTSRGPDFKLWGDVTVGPHDDIFKGYILELPQAELNKGLVAYYPFNGNAKDESGNGHDGEVKGATPTADRHGKPNTAYSFDGVDDAVDLKEHPQSNTLPITISFWAYTEQPDRPGAIIDKYTDASYNGWALRMDGSNGKIWPLYLGSLKSQIIGQHHPAYPQKKQFETQPLTASTWHHCVFTLDSIKGNIYLNGKFQDDMSWVGPPQATTSSTKLSIGNTPDGPNQKNPFKGSIDDVRIYNRALSAEEVSALYDLEKPSSETASGKKPGTLLWEFKTEGEVSSSPAIGSDGTVYVGSADKKVYALDDTRGTKKWEFETGGNVTSSPAIGADGTVYIGSVDKKLYAINGKSGLKLWEFETGGNVYSSPAIGSDGTLYVGSFDGKVYALNGKSGSKKWEFETGRTISLSSPSIGGDGTIYVGSWDCKIYALNGRTGVKKWDYRTGMPLNSAPAIGADGTVYIGSEDKKVYALDGKTGAWKWGFATGESKHGVSSSPAIGSDGTVYVGSYDNKLYALSGKSGVKLWEFVTGGAVTSSPAIGPDGTVYVGSEDGKVYALDGRSGAKKWEFETGGPIAYSSPVIGSDGTLYVGSRDNKLYAIKTDSKGPAKSPWPMRGQNAQHTGRAGTIPNSPEAAAAIEAAIRKAAGKPTGELTREDLEKIRGLAFHGEQITDVTPLAKLTNLNHLNLTKNKIIDVTSLQNLKNLEGLLLGRNQITDLTPLAHLTKLRTLHIDVNEQITDIASLAALTNLRDLNLEYCPVNDFRPLFKLVNLTSLHLGNNPNLTKAQIAQLQKALPKCTIKHDATK
jgi:outer membrane protein assembly factor BamB